MTPPSNDPLDREISDALDGVNLQDLGATEAEDTGRRNASGERMYSGPITGITGDDVFVDLGPRMQGVCSLREFDEAPEVGQVHDYTLHGREEGLWVLSRREAKALANWNSLELGSWVEAVVVGLNKGGLELKIGSNEAFMPASQVSLERVEDFAPWSGKKLKCEVLEIDRKRKRVVLSHRKVLEAERAEALKESVGKLLPGTVLKGKVTRIEAFGAFLDIGSGVEGLLHVSNISRKRVEDINEVLEVGQEHEVQILDIKEGGKRIGLSKKALEPDPWDGAEERLGGDRTVTGKVTRLMDFGAFVEIEEGLEGLLHVSQIGKERLRRPHDALSVGDEVSVRILSVDRSARRISLSRLDARGAVIGSEEAVDSGVIEDAIRSNNQGPLGTNLGDLFKKALGDKA